MEAPAGYLLVIGDRDAFRWILRDRRMAFSPHRAREAGALEIGDKLLLYTTRGCFKNPTQDRGRVVGVAQVASEVAPFRRPVEFGGQAYGVGCNLKFVSLVPRGEGVELAPMVSELNAFPNTRAWSARMRRPLVALSASDVRLLEVRLEPRVVGLTEARDSYAARPGERPPSDG